jgi:hypothetical protein
VYVGTACIIDIVGIGIVLVSTKLGVAIPIIVNGEWVYILGWL